MNATQISYEVSPTAAERLTQEDIEFAIEHAATIAFSQPEWQPGKCYRTGFTKGGRGFSISLDNRPDGVTAIIALPQEILNHYEDKGEQC